MNRFIAVSLSIVFLLHPICALAQGDRFGFDTRVYLSDGSVVEGHLIERSQELVIVEVNEQIYTFESDDVEKIVTLTSLGSDAKMTTVLEFPYISFLGATAALGLLSWLQFDTASERDADAARHEGQGSLSAGELDLSARARDLRDKADRARLWGWSSALLATGSLGVALMPKRREVRIFPELTVNEDGSKEMMLSYRHSF